MTRYDVEYSHLLLETTDSGKLRSMVVKGVRRGVEADTPHDAHRAVKDWLKWSFCDGNRPRSFTSKPIEIKEG